MKKWKRQGLDNFCSESARIEGVPEKFDDPLENSVVGMESKTSLRNEVAEEKLQNRSIGRVGMNGNENKNLGEIKKSGVVWWKMPMEFLRYCLFRKSPVWNVSVAAAVMGLVILGRRSYQMNRVAFEDKKASQVMSRAAGSQLDESR